jgi:diaminohydroxyphosphoribosylaminopyrimidine deaminase/5-amino-6-(5-phosphoribosylamino)uracil reductase
MVDKTDERYMRMALALARKGAGRTSPNPMVGAVVVRGGRVVGRGYHRRAGEAHAEIIALAEAGRAARGATLYVNLEPCSHYGRTPPCIDAVVRAGVSRVVAGMIDPNRLVAGRGVESLERAGIRVDVPVREEECRRINEAFVKHVTRKLPFIVLKLAASLDGRIATSAGDSKWVTGQKARRYVHELRNRYDAVLVGSGTVLVDDPQLTCRLRRGRNPWRVVLDRRLRTPMNATLLRQTPREKTIVVTSDESSTSKRTRLERSGIQVWTFPAPKGTIPFRYLLRRLGRVGITSVMIEGGAITASRAISEKVVDKVLCFYAPKVIGGDGLPMVGSLGVVRMSRCYKVRDTKVRKVGEDVLVTAYL